MAPRHRMLNFGPHFLDIEFHSVGGGPRISRGIVKSVVWPWSRFTAHGNQTVAGGGQQQPTPHPNTPSSRRERVQESEGNISGNCKSSRWTFERGLKTCWASWNAYAMEEKRRSGGFKLCQRWTKWDISYRFMKVDPVDVRAERIIMLIHEIIGNCKKDKTIFSYEIWEISLPECSRPTQFCSPVRLKTNTPTDCHFSILFFCFSPLLLTSVRCCQKLSKRNNHSWDFCYRFCFNHNWWNKLVLEGQGWFRSDKQAFFSQVF